MKKVLLVLVLTTISMTMSCNKEDSVCVIDGPMPNEIKYTDWAPGRPDNSMKDFRQWCDVFGGEIEFRK